MFKPQSLKEVYELAENEEKKLVAIRRCGSYSKGSGQFQKVTPFKSIGKCFKCEDNWKPGH